MGDPSHADLERMRHSCAHLLAAAIQELWPGTQFGVGPATEQGFYYDVRAPEPIGETDLARIEKRMRRLQKRRLPIRRSEWPVGEAIEQMRAAAQGYKVELLELLRTRGSTAAGRAVEGPAEVDSPLSSVTFYDLGGFRDLCRGPHVGDSGETGAFRLVSLAGAYWRGDERNDQLQRIYGLCFASEPELEQALARREEARRRDHRALGARLGLFHISPEVGTGLPLWLPRGTALRDELERLAREQERRDGYQRVVTPHITREALYFRSRHLPYYADDMYAPLEIDSERFYLRPMNCPHHHQVYLAAPRSYRDLPLRLAEHGQVYRYEASGSLSGLMRTRGFCQNDAHIYCARDQAKGEFVRVLRMHAHYYELFGIEDYWMSLSLPDERQLGKYVANPEAWLATAAILREAIDESGHPYTEAPGEAAFYGPKVDFMIRSAVGTEYAISTGQLDFLAAETFDLAYAGADGQRHPVYVIHRAPLGSHERFVAFLIEHFAGRFPTWLSPLQVRVIPISDRHAGPAEQVRAALEGADIPTGTEGLRVDLDDRPERMQRKIRNAWLEEIPYLAIVGDREVETGTVSVRLRDGSDLGALPLPALIDRLRSEVSTRTDLAPPPPEAPSPGT